jgi:hypothetical protein
MCITQRASNIARIHECGSAGLWEALLTSQAIELHTQISLLDDAQGSGLHRQCKLTPYLACWEPVGRIFWLVVPLDAEQVRGPGCSNFGSLFSQGSGYGSLNDVCS